MEAERAMATSGSDKGVKMDNKGKGEAVALPA